jgi:hypothetical protein
MKQLKNIDQQSQRAGMRRGWRHFGRSMAQAFGLMCQIGMLVPALQAQARTVAVVLRDGTVLQASRLEGRMGESVELTTDAGVRRLPATELLALAGVVVQPLALPVAVLQGGDRVVGALAGGAESGDTVVLQSPVLGRYEVAVDRLVSVGAAGADRLPLLPLPRGVDEALCRRLPAGHDWIAGTLHQFGSDRISFQPEGQPAPRWYDLHDLLGLRLASGEARADRPGAVLRTRTGDLLGVQVVSFGGGAVQVLTEGAVPRELRLPDVASVVWLGRGTFLSDLEPERVEEAGFEGDVLYPYQRDLAVVGTPLLAAGRSYAKGLGVHSQCRLTYTVPAGAAQFWTLVAFDDSAAALPLRPEVDLRILVADREVFRKQGLAPGGEPLAPGMFAVQPGQRLQLEVDFGAGRELGDRINWLLPVFLPPRER